MLKSIRRWDARSLPDTGFLSGRRRPVQQLCQLRRDPARLVVREQLRPTFLFNQMAARVGGVGQAV
jgi:hypothetical protein